MFTRTGANSMARTERTSTNDKHDNRHQNGNRTRRSDNSRHRGNDRNRHKTSKTIAIVITLIAITIIILAVILANTGVIGTNLGTFDANVSLTSGQQGDANGNENDTDIEPTTPGTSTETSTIGNDTNADGTQQPDDGSNANDMASDGGETQAGNNAKTDRERAEETGLSDYDASVKKVKTFATILAGCAGNDNKPDQSLVDGIILPYDQLLDKTKPLEAYEQAGGYSIVSTDIGDRVRAYRTVNRASSIFPTVSKRVINSMTVTYETSGDGYDVYIVTMDCTDTLRPEFVAIEGKETIHTKAVLTCGIDGWANHIICNAIEKDTTLD